MSISEFQGLTLEEVQQQKKLGLANQKIDTFSPTYFQIIRRNLFSLMNLILFPFLGLLAYFKLQREVYVFLLFVFANTIVNSFEEIRIKKRLEKLITQFQQKATVIRDGEEKIIPASEIVKGDYIKAVEGDGILTDGIIVFDEYLQIDESALTGESDYIKKVKGEKIRSGSFVVTGECVYVAQKVGKDNYLNKLGSKTLKYKKTKSKLESVGDRFIYFFVISGVIATLLTLYFINKGGASDEDILLSMTTIVTMIVPQTLIFLFGLTFVISITKLANKGILVQKRGAIDDLAGIDTICIDKTGTITTNKMEVSYANYIGIDEKEFGEIFISFEDEIRGKNKTVTALEKYFKEVEKKAVSEIDQIPFTSKQKYSAVKGIINGEEKIMVLGAFSVVKKLLAPEIQKEVSDYVEQEESKGLRILVGGIINNTNNEVLKLNDLQSFLETNEGAVTSPRLQLTTSVAIFSILERLNPGIKEVISDLKDSGIDIVVISGDSANSVSRVAEKINLGESKILDLNQTKLSNKNILSNQIFTRAKPEDKLEIITVLRKSGRNVAMIGDGINDVLGMKQATVSIAMEYGSKITRDIADVVLLKNNYKKIPQIFSEGNNIVFNLKLTTKIYLAKAFIAYVLAIYFSYVQKPVPLLPSTTLIFSFLGGTLISYIIAFSRQKIARQTEFTNNIIRSGVPAGIFMGVATVVMYQLFKDELNFMKLNTFLALSLLALSIIYVFYLVWEAKKLSNLKVLGVLFFVLFFYGVAQSVLPFYEYLDEPETAVFYAYMAVWASCAIFFAFSVNNRTLKDRKYMDRVKWVVVLGHLLIALFFPCRDYYATEPVSIKFFPAIFILAAVGILANVVIHRIGDRIGNEFPSLRGDKGE